MNKQEILDLLTNFSSRFPQEAIEGVRANREDFIPELLESLDYACRNAKELCEKNDKGDNYYMYIYAMFLLAEFREKKAFPYLIEFLRLPEKHVDFLLGDILIESFKNILLCTYDGKNIQMLRDVMENQELFEYARIAALDAYALLHMEGHVSQEDFILYMRSLIYDRLLNDDSYMIHTAIVGCIIDTLTIQMIPDARFLYENNKVDTSMHGGYDSFLDWMFYKKPYKERPRYIDNAIDKMKWWSCFEDEHPERKPDKNEKSFEKIVADGMKVDRDLKRLAAQKKKKPGRNEPCYCGSGKKYKKCCLDGDDNSALSPSGKSVTRVEDVYDLLEMYPTDSPLFKELYEEEAINIDMLVYKAIHHRAISMWVERDLKEEQLGKINYLNEALGLFLNKCEREQITSFAAYDERYMVHYRSADWVSALIDLTKGVNIPGTADIRKKATDVLDKFA